MLFKTRDVFIFAVIAGILVSLVLLALPWPRGRYRWLIAGVATALGWIAWNLLLNETDASGFDVDAPVVMASWQDAGSGVLAFMVAALALTAYEPKETALRIVGSAALAGIVAFVFDIFVL